MPTLIRLFVILLVLAGLAYGGMVALVAMVEPKEKEVTLRIPARDLVPSPQRDPLVMREINTSRPAPAAQPATEPVPVELTTAPAAPAADGEVVTLSPGIE